MLRELDFEEMDDVFGGASGMMSLSVASASPGAAQPNWSTFGSIGTYGSLNGGCLGTAGTAGTGACSVSLCVG